MSQIKQGAIYHRDHPEVRSAEYRAFVRKFPCAVCKSTRRVEAAHTGGHGMSQKASDLSCVALCPNCHTIGNESLHRLGPREFQARHLVDLAELASMYRELYNEQQARRAA